MNDNRDVIEFYLAGKLVAHVPSSFRFQVGDLISVLAKTYRILRVTFALDHVADSTRKGMRCNIDIEQVK